MYIEGLVQNIVTALLYITIVLHQALAIDICSHEVPYIMCWTLVIQCLYFIVQCHAMLICVSGSILTFCECNCQK